MSQLITPEDLADARAEVHRWQQEWGRLGNRVVLLEEVEEAERAADYYRQEIRRLRSLLRDPALRTWCLLLDSGRATVELLGRWGIDWLSASFLMALPAFAVGGVVFLAFTRHPFLVFGGAMFAYLCVVAAMIPILYGGSRPTTTSRVVAIRQQLAIRTAMLTALRREAKTREEYCSTLSITREAQEEYERARRRLASLEQVTLSPPDGGSRMAGPRRGTGFFECPFCHTNHPPSRRSRISTGGWVVFVVGFFVCFPVSLIGLFITEDYHVCSVCGVKLG